MWWWKEKSPQTEAPSTEEKGESELNTESTPDFDGEVNDTIQTEEEVQGASTSAADDIVSTQSKCPKCGSTDISPNPQTGNLRCNYCRFEFQAEVSSKVISDASSLEGETLSENATDIQESEALLTLKCPSCGAEVVIDTDHATQARCHWCRNYLSLNDKVPNGAVPDLILPFKHNKETAQTEINKFVSSRRFFAAKTFRKEFTTENILGVYFPYMIIDAKEHVELYGEGEIQTACYHVRVGKNSSRTYYNAQGYNLRRSFDLSLTGLTIESSSSRRERSKQRTDNVINAIMPFDTENCVDFDANYMRGYTAEKRDSDVGDLKSTAKREIGDIGRYASRTTIQQYDRGVRWDRENNTTIGIHWNTAYLPVWLYSYYEKKKDVLHYVAFNARTKETVGSVPINMPRLLFFSLITELLGCGVCMKLMELLAESKDEISLLPLAFLSSGFLFYYYFHNRYRNDKARHNHESETSHKMENLKCEDIRQPNQKKRLTNSMISGCNATPLSTGKNSSPDSSFTIRL